MIAWLLLFGMSHGLAASTPPVPGYEATPAGGVLSMDGSLILGDGRKARLEGVELARLPPGEGPSSGLAALLGQKDEVLKALNGAGPLTLWSAPGAQPDRWGRLPVEAVAADGRWVQGELLAKGLARVMTMAEEDAAAHDLLAAERPAREAGIGLWADRHYAVRDAGEAYRFTNGVQVFKGVVSSVRMTKSAVYVNFGENWRRDLGLRVKSRLVPSLIGDPRRWTGRRVLVRGWVIGGSSPLIEPDHEGQIEILD